MGTGVDVTPIARVARLITDHSARLDRIFTAGERGFCEAARGRARDARYAAAFAAKEAVMKALGTGWRSDIEWSDIDTRTLERHGGIALSGGIRRAAERLGVARVIVSAAATGESAVATAVAEGAPKSPKAMLRRADLSIVTSALLGAVVLATTAMTASSDGPIAWSEVAASYAAVHDYTATYEKRERAIDHGHLQTIRLSFRKPLDVRLDWLDDKGTVDQTAVYRKGQNDGKLVARRSGILGSMVGTIRLDPHDKRALEDSRHPITEVGIGHMIELVDTDLREGRVRSRPVADEAVDGHAAYRFQLDAPAGVPLFGIEGASRANVWVDHALKLPVKVEILDAAGAMIERHHFKNLRLNVGLADDLFTL